MTTMHKTVTVDEALARGKRMVEYPFWSIVISSLGITLGTLPLDDFPEWLSCLIFLAGLRIACIYRMVVVTRWQLWALENVRNVHELYNRGTLMGLVEDEHFITLVTASSREKLQELVTKFDIPDIFTDDLTIPSESDIYYEKNWFAVILYLLFSVIFFAIGYESLFEQTQSTKLDYWSGFIFLSISSITSYHTYRIYKKTTNREPQIRIHSGGIEMPEVGFLSWNDIQDEQVYKTYSSKTTFIYLRYVYQGNKETINIGSYDIKDAQLEKLLRIYRGRYEQTMSSVGSHTIKSIGKA